MAENISNRNYRLKRLSNGKVHRTLHLGSELTLVSKSSVSENSMIESDINTLLKTYKKKNTKKFLNEDYNSFNGDNWITD